MSTLQLGSLRVGDTAIRKVLISEDSVSLFVKLSGDNNPIHTDEAYAKSTRFGQRIAPGIQIASYISAVLANELPGPGTIYLEQMLKFEAPVHFGDEITVTVTIEEFPPRRGVVSLSTICVNQHDVTVISGRALVKIPVTACQQTPNI